MHGYIKTLLITAMSAGAVATGNTASVATLDPTPPPLIAATHYDKDWPATPGNYKSLNRRARAKGHIKVTYTAPGKNSAHITGQLYDKDRRDVGQGGKCAYIRFRYHYVGGDWSWKEYTHCGYNTFRPIDLTQYNVDEVRLKVCQVPWQPPHTPTSCKVKKIYPTVSPLDL